MKKSLTYIFVLLLAFTAQAQQVFTQADEHEALSLDTLINKLVNFSIQRPVEKVSLHLNKPAYVSGDTIWLKGYTVVGPLHRPSALSGVLYVELINEQNKIVRSLTLQNDNGISAGDITLDDDLQPGLYHIRAYTNWMRNAGPLCFYDQAIPVMPVYAGVTAASTASTSTPATIPAAAPATATINPPDVQFLPEGGLLLNGVRSKVAFKAIDSNGLGVDIKGTITDNEGNDVAEFSARHAGMGVFALLPQTGKTYTAKISYGNNLTLSVPLPKAEDEGFVLAVNTNADDSTKLNVRVSTNEQTLNTRKGQSFYIVGQSGQKPYYTTTSKLDNTSFVASVPKDRFPAGIAQFTLLSANNEPLNERLVFIDNRNDLLDMELTTDKAVYNAKGKTELSLTAKDERQKPLQGNFSISIYKEEATANEDNEGTLLTHLLLTSDLKGYIETPGYYFNKSGKQVETELDNLLLAQGYRRFNWQEIVSNKPTPILYPAEKSLAMSGTVTTAKGKPVVKGTVSVLSLADGINLNTTTDTSGRFSIANIDLPDSAMRKLLVQARTDDGGKNVNIRLNAGHNAPVVLKSSPAEIAVATSMRMSAIQAGDYLAIARPDSSKLAANIKGNGPPQNKGKTLKEVVIKEKAVEKPDQTNAYGAAPPATVISGETLQDHSIRSAILLTGKVILSGRTFVTPEHVIKKSDAICWVILDNTFISQGELNDLNVDIIENIKIIDAVGVKMSYGIPPTVKGPLILVTTKQFAGTAEAKKKPDEKARTLKEVTIKDRKNAGTELAPWITVSQHSANLNGPGHADMVFSAKDFDNCFDFFTCFLNKIPGIDRTQDHAKWGAVVNGTLYLAGEEIDYFSRNHNKSMGGHPADIKYLLDGVFVKPVNIEYLDVHRIASVEVLENGSYTSIYGPFAVGGLIIITTKNGNEDPDKTDADYNAIAANGVLTIKFKGYYKAREFYSPKYTPTNQNITDTRTAIYWNPNVLTDANGTFKTEFFNSDVKGTYRAVVEGIDNDGNIGRFVYRYKVE